MQAQRLHLAQSYSPKNQDNSKFHLLVKWRLRVIPFAGIPNKANS